MLLPCLTGVIIDIIKPLIDDIIEKFRALKM